MLALIRQLTDILGRLDEDSDVSDEEFRAMEELLELLQYLIGDF